MRDENTTPRALSRRDFLQRSGAAAGALALWGALPAPARAAGSLVYAGFGGIYEQGIRQAVLTPFQQKSGIQVEVTTGAASVAKIRAMVATKHPEWDVVDATGPAYGQLLAENLIQKLDYSLINTSDLANPNYASPKGSRSTPTATTSSGTPR